MKTTLAAGFLLNDGAGNSLRFPARNRASRFTASNVAQPSVISITTGESTSPSRKTTDRPGSTSTIREPLDCAFISDGPRGNPFGIGATLRLISARRSEPIREIHAGSGYWSQDSLTQVLANSRPATEIRVQWPGGNTKTSATPPGAQEIEIDSIGQLRLIK